MQTSEVSLIPAFTIVVECNVCETHTCFMLASSVEKSNVESCTAVARVESARVGGERGDVREPADDVLLRGAERQAPHLQDPCMIGGVRGPPWSRRGRPVPAAQRPAHPRPRHARRRATSIVVHRRLAVAVVRAADRRWPGLEVLLLLLLLRSWGTPAIVRVHHVLGHRLVVVLHPTLPLTTVCHPSRLSTPPPTTHGAHDWQQHSTRHRNGGVEP